MEIETKCKGCVFYDGDLECSLGRYEKFKENGAEISFIDDIHHPRQNPNTPTMIVKGRFCSAKRPSQWAEGKNKINLPLIVRAELLVNYEVIIPITDVDSSALEITLKSLNKQLVKPSLIVLNCTSNKIKYPNLIRQLKNQKLPFRVDRMLSNDRFALETSLDKVKTDYYLILESGTNLDEEYVANIDEAINVELKRFLIVTNKIGDFVYFPLHKNLEGNYPIRASKIDEDCQDDTLILNSLQDKVKYLANKNNQHFLIKSYQEILNG